MGQLIRESGYVLSLWFLLCFSTMSLSASTSKCWERSVLTCLGARSSRPPGGGGAQAVMSRRDAGLFLHAMYLFPPLYFPPFKKTNAFRASCCPSLWVLCPPCPCPGQAVPPAPPQAGCAARALGPIPCPRPCCCCHAGSKYKSTLPHIPKERGLLCSGAFLTPRAAESQQIRVIMGGDYSSVNQAGN